MNEYANIQKIIVQSQTELINKTTEKKQIQSETLWFSTYNFV